VTTGDDAPDLFGDASVEIAQARGKNTISGSKKRDFCIMTAILGIISIYFVTFISSTNTHCEA
jgi:hypothetical protein